MVEARILSILKRCGDLSSMSAELACDIVDQTTALHLGATHANLLRPFAFGHDDVVLELGAACGSLTRWFAEQGASVTAIESNPVGRQCVVERCRDLPNPPTVYGSMKSVPDDRVFTAVTCIGAFEQANHWLATGRNSVEIFRHIADRLTPDGRLFLAIDNQLGLKFLGGAAEEQTGKPYVGINDLYESDAAGTYGKQELGNLLRSSGFTSLEWFYPFPDYRLPTLIISEEAFHDGRLNVADLLSDLFTPTNMRNRVDSLRECLAWRTVAKNGLLGELSNAFLVVARKEPQEAKNLAPSWLATRYRTSHGQRHSKEIIFRPESSHVAIVRRRLVPNDALFSERAVVPFRFTHVLADSTYIPGKLYGPDVYKILARGGTVDDIVAWMKPWVGFLEARTVAPPSLSWPVPASMRWISGDLIDCIPFNLVYAGDGTLRFVDVEWQSHDPIPLPWVIARGVFHRIFLYAPESTFPSFTYRSLLSAIFPRFGIDATDELFSVIARFDNAWMEFVHLNRTHRPVDFSVRLTWPIERPPDQCHGLAADFIAAEFIKAKQTLGWQVLSMYWRIVERIFPGRSTRRRILDRLAKACRRAAMH